MFLPSGVPQHAWRSDSVDYRRAGVVLWFIVKAQQHCSVRSRTGVGS